MKADYDKLLLTPGLQLVYCSSVCFPHRLKDTWPILLQVLNLQSSNPCPLIQWHKVMERCSSSPPCTGCHRLTLHCNPVHYLSLGKVIIQIIHLMWVQHMLSFLLCFGYLSNQKEIFISHCLLVLQSTKRDGVVIKLNKLVTAHWVIFAYQPYYLKIFSAH